MPNTLTELRQKKKLKQLSVEEADVANILALEQRRLIGRPRAATAKGAPRSSAVDASTIASQVIAVERELGALRHSLVSFFFFFCECVYHIVPKNW